MSDAEQQIATLQAWKNEATAALAEKEELRSRFNDKAVALGYAGWHYLESACEIADRCVKAEAEIRELRTDRLINLADRHWIIHFADSLDVELLGPFDTKDDALAAWRHKVQNQGEVKA